MSLISLLSFAGASSPGGGGSAHHCLLVLASGHQLSPVQAVVQAPALQELIVRAYLFNPTALDHSNLVGVPDGGQAVGNHNAGAALLGNIKSCLDCLSQRKAEIGREGGGLKAGKEEG